MRWQTGGLTSHSLSLWLWLWLQVCHFAAPLQLSHLGIQVLGNVGAEGLALGRVMHMAVRVVEVHGLAERAHNVVTAGGSEGSREGIVSASPLPSPDFNTIADGVPQNQTLSWTLQWIPGTFR